MSKLGTQLIIFNMPRWCTSGEYQVRRFNASDESEEKSDLVLRWYRKKGSFRRVLALDTVNSLELVSKWYSPKITVSRADGEAVLYANWRVTKGSDTEIQVGRGSLLLQISVDTDCRHYKVNKGGDEVATIDALEGWKSEKLRKTALSRGEAERDKIQWQVAVLTNVVTKDDPSWEDLAWMSSDPATVSLKLVSYAQQCH
jgi:hypothetical protein